MRTEFSISYIAKICRNIVNALKQSINNVKTIQAPIPVGRIKGIVLKNITSDAEIFLI